MTVFPLILCTIVVSFTAARVKYQSNCLSDIIQNENLLDFWCLHSFYAICVS